MLGPEDKLRELVQGVRVIVEDAKELVREPDEWAAQLGILYAADSWLDAMDALADWMEEA